MYKKLNLRVTSSGERTGTYAKALGSIPGIAEARIQESHSVYPSCFKGGVCGHCPGPQSGPGVPGLGERLSKISHGKALLLFLPPVPVDDSGAKCLLCKPDDWSLISGAHGKEEGWLHRLVLWPPQYSTHTGIEHTETHRTDNNNNNTKRTQLFLKTTHEFEALPLRVCAYTHTQHMFIAKKN